MGVSLVRSGRGDGWLTVSAHPFASDFGRDGSVRTPTQASVRDVQGQKSASRAMSWSTRRAWRPPSKSVDRKVVTISSASPSPTTRAPDREHVGVVVFAGHPGGVEAVAERGAHATDLVGGELFALPAAARGRCRRRRAPSRTVRPTPAQIGGIVDGFGRVGALVVDVESLSEQHGHEVLFEFVPGMVRADGDPSRRRIVAGVAHVARV